jgi:hypothetical protein
MELCGEAKIGGRPGCARMDRLTIGPQIGNLPHN